MPPKKTKEQEKKKIIKTPPAKEKKKPASEAQIAEYQRKIKEQGLASSAKEYDVWDEFPMPERGVGMPVRAILIKTKGGRGKLIDIFAIGSDPKNQFRLTEDSNGPIADVPVGTPLFALDDESEQRSWYCGDEPAIPGLRYSEKKMGGASKATGEEWAEFGDDAWAARIWDGEKAAAESETARPFKDATAEALVALREHERSVLAPKGIIPVVISDPQTYGPDAYISHTKGWYKAGPKPWMTPFNDGKEWKPTDPPKIGSPAALAVFRNSEDRIVRSSYRDFLADNRDASPVSLDGLEKLIPKVEDVPLTDAAQLLKLLDACDNGQLASGDYIVGLQNKYAVFRLRGATSGKPLRVVPRISGSSGYDLPNGGYVAYGYTIPPAGKDLVQRYDATVSNKDLTINGTVGPEVEIWPKSPARRQALIDADKPAPMDVASATKGEWRLDLSAFCGHYGIADGSQTGVVVFPMKDAGVTKGYLWHVTASAADVEDYLRRAPRSQGPSDPPPTLEELWLNVQKIHVTVEWYRGAWNSPVNPRIYADTGDWSYLAKVGTQAGSGRPTRDPFTGITGPTTVTRDIRDDYYDFINGISADTVTAAITTKNIAS